MSGIAPSIRRSTALSLCTILLNVACGLVVSVVAARSFGVHGFASYVYVSWLASTIAVLAAAGFPALVLRLTAERIGTNDLSSARDAITRLTRRATTVSFALAIVLVVTDQAFAFIGLAPFDAGLVVLLATTQTSSAMVGYAAQGAGRYDLALRWALRTTATASILAVIAPAIGGAVREMLCLLALGQLTLSVGLGRDLLAALPAGALNPIQENPANRAYFWSVAAIVALDLVVWQRSEVFFLERFSSQRDLSLYATAFALAVATVRMAPAALAGVLTPAFAHLIGAGRAELVRPLFDRAVTVTALVTGLLAITAAGLGPSLLLIYGRDFVAAASALPWLIIGLAIGNVSGVASNVFHGLGRARRLLHMGAVLAFVNLALDWLLIPAHGAVGAAIACASPQLLSLPMAAIMLRQEAGFSFSFVRLLRVSVPMAGATAALATGRTVYGSDVTLDFAMTAIAIVVFLWLWMVMRGPADLAPRAVVTDPPPPLGPGPLVSIIIPTKNRPDFVVEAITRATGVDGPTRELIVIDSSDDDATQAILTTQFSEVLRVRVRGMPNNRHFAKNQGIRIARGKILCFLDDDSFVEPGWLERTLALYDDPTVGAAGGRIIDQIFESGPVGEKVGKIDANGRLHLNFTRHPGDVIDIDHAIGCNMSFRASVLAEIGGFDLCYGGPNFMEETDLYLRARAAGYRVRFDPDAVVRHQNAPRDGGLVRRPLDPGGEFWSARSRAYFALKFLPRTVAVLRYNALGLLKMHLLRGWTERSSKHWMAAGLQTLGLLFGLVDWLLNQRPRVSLQAVLRPPS